jgi:hypothetical protein
MLQVRHRTASGSLSEMWEFDNARRVIDVVLRVASAKPIAFTVPVCAPDRARIGAYPVMRLDGESWRVLPARFVLEHGLLVPHDAAIHESFGRGSQIVLTHAPADVDAELESL